jgi:pimeloyl-ACP methyl ester carboxylesterase
VEAWFTPFTIDFPAAMDDLSRRNFGPHADPGLVEAVTAKAREADQTRVMGLLESQFNYEHAVVEALAHIDAPVFAVNPDFKSNDEASFARHGVEFRIIPGVGHFVMLEAPEAFNAELTDILTRLQ